MGFFAKAQKKIQEATTQSIQFLQDQDGPMERTLKEKLAELFRDLPQVLEAYFARVMYTGNVQGVALCVYGTPEMDSQLVLKGVSQVYVRLLKTDQGMHTIFLTESQRTEINAKCHAFYRSSVM